MHKGPSPAILSDDQRKTIASALRNFVIQGNRQSLEAIDEFCYICQASRGDSDLGVLLDQARRTVGAYRKMADQEHAAPEYIDDAELLNNVLARIIEQLKSEKAENPYSQDAVNLAAIKQKYKRATQRLVKAFKDNGIGQRELLAYNEELGRGIASNVTVKSFKPRRFVPPDSEKPPRSYDLATTGSSFSRPEPENGLSKIEEQQAAGSTSATPSR